MKAPKRALAIVAITALVSCSSPRMPANTPDNATVTPPLRIYATTATLPLVTELTSSYAEQNIMVETRSGNLQSMLAKILEGEAPYFVTNHLPTDSPLWAAPLAQDALAIIVNPAVSIRNLTFDQLRDLYQGKISNWSELNGPDLPVSVVTREDGSGTRAQFEAQAMGPRLTTRMALLASSNQNMLDIVLATPGAIGYVSQAYTASSEVSVLALNGILPTLENIASSRYALRTTIFIAGLREPRDDAYRAFIGWAQSPAGQAVIARRYAPLLMPISTEQ